MTTYANQMTVTFSQNEAILHFAFIAPKYEANGNVSDETQIVAEQNIVLTSTAFLEFAKLINKVAPETKE